MIGAITQRDITDALLARGITARVGAQVTLPPPADPTQAITVLPRVPAGDDDYQPYIPIYPPATIPPGDMAPYYPGEAPAEEKKGLSKGLLLVIGIGAVALMVLARPKPIRREGSYRPRRRLR